MKNFNNEKTTGTVSRSFAASQGESDTNKATYRCAICGKSYDTIDERVTCETKCLAARKKAQEELEKKKLEEEKTTRKAEIEKKFKELSNLVNDYCKDYGSLQLGESRYFEDNLPTLSKLLGWWWQ